MKIIITLSTFLTLSCSKTPQFNGNYSYNLTKEQLAFGPRNPGSIGHANVTKWIVKKLKKTNAEIKYQSFKWEDKRFKKVYPLNNIIASFYKEKTHRILLAAHFDTNPISEKEIIDSLKMKPILGALDGATGVSILLQLAKLISIQEPSYGVDIVFFDGEDLGDVSNPENYCIGSKEFAKIMKSYRPNFGILLDLVGHKTAIYRYEMYSYTRQQSLVDELWQIAESLNFHNTFVKEKGLAISDDHLPLLDVGIPIINVIDMDIIEGKDKIHHTQNDIIDFVSSESLYIVGSVILKKLYE